MQTDKLGWGYKSDAIEAPALWGARAIFTGRKVDILWDRQDMIGETKDRTALSLALNGRGANGGALDAFRRLVEAGEVETEDGGSTTDLKGVRFYCGERRSGGYLYITAHLIPG